jgi:NADH-quinone oxidoreductase subunit E
MPLVDVNKVELPAQVRDFIQANRAHYPTPRAGLIPALMECQKHFGHISPGVIAALADEMGVPFAEVESVVSFYTMFFTRPMGKFIIGVCCTWNCEHAGGRSLVAHFEQKYGTTKGEVTPDGLFCIEYVECLCDCHNAPSVQILATGPEFQAYWCNNLTVELFDKVLDELKAGAPDACRERLVRVEPKQNPPDDKKWMWITTTNNQYPAWIESKDGALAVHDSFGKLTAVKENNPKLYAELQAALKG